ncbi:unnamed protein product [Thlaspi arvense]|uniref:Neprosin PEP catalytic domain-containing protein n=1 Tax=Thlaspi arvense TaxID=13288 RepID=A0AAU9RG57_THLAR|nr:unnamed protein product [Thlaspi arvense]
MDAELNILALSSDQIGSINQVPTKEDSEGLSEAEQDLKSLKDDAPNDDLPVGPLIKKCCTMDQGKSANRIIIVAAVWLLLLFTYSGATPILTIQSPDGDSIDCLDRMDQPSLQNPLLKNHVIQETPSHMVKTEEGFGWQVWHSGGTACPRGTIPVRRFETNVSHSKNNPDAADRATRGHQYAIAQMQNQSFYGTKATLNVWSPVVESPDDFSLAQIWLVSGHYQTNDINTVEAGWQVFPNRYHDRQSRLFTYWTRDAYVRTGCYSTHCVGFVHVSSTIALEAAIAPTSTFGGDQFDITLQIWKDGSIFGELVVGYGREYRADWILVFTTLSDHATTIQWGGEVLYRNTSGMNTTTQMGSGRFPDEGFRKAAYFCNIQIAQENRTFLPLQDFNFTMGDTQRDSYTIKKAHNQACGTHFYYGGPGPLRSASDRVSFTFLLFSFSFFVFVV